MLQHGDARSATVYHHIANHLKMAPHRLGGAGRGCHLVHDEVSADADMPLMRLMMIMMMMIMMMLIAMMIMIPWMMVMMITMMVIVMMWSTVLALTVRWSQTQITVMSDVWRSSSTD